MSVSTTLYEYVPASVAIAGGGTADLIIQNVSVQKGGREVRFTDGVSVEKMIIGSGGLNFSGVMAVNSTIDDIISKIESETVDITIGSTTFRNCECRGCNVSVAGSGQTAVFIKGSISYSFDYTENDDIPSMTEARFVWGSMGISLQRTTDVNKVVKNGTQWQEYTVFGRYNFTVTRYKRFDSSTFSIADMDTTPPGNSIFNFVQVVGLVYTEGGSDVEEKHSVYAPSNPEDGKVSWHLAKQNVQFHEEGYAELVQTWVAHTETTVIDEWKKEVGGS